MYSPYNFQKIKLALDDYEPNVNKVSLYNRLVLNKIMCIIKYTLYSTQIVILLVKKLYN